MGVTDALAESCSVVRACCRKQVKREKQRVSEMRDLQEKLDLSEAKNRINNWVAISVAILSVFMAITKVKDDNIVQAMLQAKSDAVDIWNEYQSKKIKHHLGELGLNQVQAFLALERGKGSEELSSQQKRYQETIARYQEDEILLTKKAREFEKQYDDLNFRNDQFDLSDALISISLAMLAVTSLTGKRKLFLLAWFFAGFGLIMGVARTYGAVAAS
ncbi:MAG: DUF4337 domain-containing protein [Chlorobium sp.]|nr:MAG: DUF4337 domain-containing protein [Chlorobium sp.]